MPAYLNTLIEYLDTEPIKVLSGVRRCGKSTLLEMLYEHLKASVPAENLVLLKCDSSNVPLNASAEWLDDHVQQLMKKANSDHRIYFLLDEVQEIDSWERVIRRIHTDKNTDVYITGSNAFLLSSDLATYLSGRYIEIHVYPLSFKEYVSFSRELGNEANGEDALFAEYMRYGGMPGLFGLRKWSEDGIALELQSIHDTVILNDVAKRFEIRDIDLLEKLVKYLFSTSGNLFSTRSIVGALNSSGRKVYAETIDSYIDALRRAFLIYQCEQEGVQGKSLLRPMRKFYAPDTGLRNLEIGFASKDIGFQLESIVAIELARRGFKFAVGSLKEGEIDFVASKRDERLYIQVSQSVMEASTLEREICPLEFVGDSFPKFVLTLDRIGLGVRSDGIKVMNLIDWLLQDAGSSYERSVTKSRSRLSRITLRGLQLRSHHEESEREGELGMLQA